jgi:hypothetical protein
MPKVTLTACDIPFVAFLADRLPNEAEQTAIQCAAEAELHAALAAHGDDLPAALTTLEQSLIALGQQWQERLARHA